MKYTVKVRLQRGANTEMIIPHANNIKEASKIVRAKYGLDTDNPHRGFVIEECYVL